MQLVWPAEAYLEGMRDALARGWSPDSQRGTEAAREELALIDADPPGYLAAQVDREARGAPIRMPDGSLMPRLPGYRRWIWDGVFCGIVGLRWQPGTTDLPPYCLGHVGYSVVPWQQRRGHATRALGLILDDARDEGLPFVTVTTAVDNLASQRVIAANGGVLVEAFDQPPEHAGAPSLRYRIALA
ncbi:MAG: GNAT family N-acetyltransferase [Burkholderiaceae bacterium]